LYNNENETSLYNKVDTQEKLLLFILNTIKRLKSKSRIFRYLAKECKSRYNKLNNLLRHIRSLNDNKHKYVTNKIKSKFCNRCDKILSKQCDYIRYIRNKHSNVNLDAWKRQQYVTSFLIIVFVLFMQRLRLYFFTQQAIIKKWHNHNSYALRFSRMSTSSDKESRRHSRCWRTFNVAKSKTLDRSLQTRNLFSLL